MTATQHITRSCHAAARVETWVKLRTHAAAHVAAELENLMATRAKEAKIEIYEGGEGGGKGRWRFRVVAANGEPIAYGEGYVDKAEAYRAVVRLAQLFVSGGYNVVES